MSKYVRIQSSINITVTSGLQGIDLTRQDSDIPNRLNLAPSWPKTRVDIEAGSHWYPAEIAEWSTVKALQNDNIITVGEFSDEANDCKIDAEQFVNNLEEVKEDMNFEVQKESVSRRGRRKQATLDEISE